MPEGFSRNECFFTISFQDTGGGDNHHAICSNDGYVYGLNNVQTYRYLVIGIKKIT